MSETIQMTLLVCGVISILAFTDFTVSIYSTIKKEQTKRLAIEALKSNVELKLNSADLKELFK